MGRLTVLTAEGAGPCAGGLGMPVVMLLQSLLSVLLFLFLVGLVVEGEGYLLLVRGHLWLV